MEKIEIGKPAPQFCLPDMNENTVCLKDFAGKWVILYFYPKDGTPGCINEAKDFTSYKEKFEKFGAVIIGVSPDAPKTHRKFAEKHGLSILLLSDINREVAKLYDVLKPKKLYGKVRLGIERSTFIIDPEGVIVHEWRKVKVKGHVEKVFQKFKEIALAQFDKSKIVP